MAGADYIKCWNCGNRIFYAPDAEEIEVICMKCYNGVNKTIGKLEKEIRRRR